MYEYTRSKFTLKTVYFVNSKGIGRSEMNNYPSCQYQYTPQTLVLWDHIYNILRGKKQKQEYPFLASKYIKRKLTQTLLHGRVIVEVHGPSLLIRYTLLLFLQIFKYLLMNIHNLYCRTRKRVEQENEKNMDI